MYSDLKYCKELREKSAKIQELFIKNRRTLALAESCTGGLLSFFLTEKPGASRFFLGSVVSYSYSAKTKFLDVPADLLKNQGAVNESVCRLMAQSVKKKWKSDWALSLTGVAGPERMDKDPPVGVAFIGVFGPNGSAVKPCVTGLKSRQDIRQKSAIFALDFLQSCITIGGQIKPYKKEEVE